MGHARHTMGQDWGGRRSSNPSGCPKVTKKNVLDFAKSFGAVVVRDGGNFSMWFIVLKERRVTLGMTNFIALQTLERIKEEGIPQYFDRIYDKKKQ